VSSNTLILANVLCGAVLFVKDVLVRTRVISSRRIKSDVLNTVAIAGLNSSLCLINGLRIQRAHEEGQKRGCIECKVKGCVIAVISTRYCSASNFALSLRAGQ
jgi:hypothetical protein